MTWVAERLMLACDCNHSTPCVDSPLFSGILEAAIFELMRQHRGQEDSSSKGVGDSGLRVEVQVFSWWIEW